MNRLFEEYLSPSRLSYLAHGRGAPVWGVLCMGYLVLLCACVLILCLEYAETLGRKSTSAGQYITSCTLQGWMCIILGKNE